MHTYKSYTIGFVLSLALTLAAYFAVVNHAPATLFVIIGLALAQLLVQLIFFLHVGQGEDGGWNFLVLFSTFSVIFILVVGSLWIMYHLNYRMTPNQMNDYMMHQENMMKK